MSFQTNKLEENEERTVMLNNEKVSVKDFNKTLESLNKNQRVVESSDKNFHIVERMYD